MAPEYKYFLLGLDNLECLAKSFGSEFSEPKREILLDFINRLNDLLPFNF